MSKKYTRSEYGSYQPNSSLTQHYITTGAVLLKRKNNQKLLREKENV